MPLDVVVIGLGAMGSATLCELARRGIPATGIERFTPGHDRGSSHGLTRIIRLGYFEHPSYVPLVRCALALWRDLESECGERLLTVTGILETGRPDGPLVSGTLASARRHALDHEVLDANAVARRYPAFRLPPDFVGVVQPDAGFLEPEKAIAAQLALAARHGAAVRTGERCLAIEADGRGVRVTTERDTIAAARAIVCAGPWLGTLMPDLRLPLTVTRQAVLWVAPEEPQLFERARFPIFLHEGPHGIHYGFPLHADDGLKMAKHHHAPDPVDPDDHARTVSAAEEAAIRRAVAAFLPATADAPLRQARTCLYTMTPDGDFLIDRAPGAPQIVIASPCSGHGFKFAPVIGGALADLALRGETVHDLSRFRLARLY
ncbi:MAG: N-methyl-L-tryptophan oxidase [Pseudorhodoplanes sp.]|nr:Monomeric sarcosine oxidase [Pseudorhodoplanes sp.]MBW7948613.1 N-methyl-L-tryptophan oxidase [Pseudorhodoplanes sp.]MCL4711060.1 N-methyl-L-tryptophan oxidase [Pseudorhodoplanes sp.]MCQ3942020.1 N-methyl-L-tryptophan oxidase [Alphaproteobacteria bacterium]GIK83105.1 MAG: N-methyltryptophan oxidase [Alphaproteobacteria bacterium]